MLPSKPYLAVAPQTPSPSAQEKRRADREWLKSLKRQHADTWRFNVHHPSLDGLVRIETRREVLWLEDGVCVAAAPFSDPGASQVAVPQSSLIGLGLVAWATESGDLRDTFAPGCRAIFWASGEHTATIGLTARVQSFKPALPLTAMTRPLAVMRGAVRRLMDEEAATLPFFRPSVEALPATMRSPERAA